MADYVSKFTGTQIDANLELAESALQPANIVHELGDATNLIISQQAVSQHIRNTDDAVSDLADDLTTVETGLDSLSGQVTTVSNKVDNISDSVDTILTRMDNMSDQIDDISTNVNTKADNRLLVGSLEGMGDGPYKSAGIVQTFWNSYETQHIEDSEDILIFTCCDSDGNEWSCEEYPEEGDWVSCRSTYSADYLGKVKSFTDGKLQISLAESRFKIDTLPYNFVPAEHLYNTSKEAGGPGYLWFPDKPQIGANINNLGGYGSVAVGHNNRANEMGAFACGLNNMADGRYSFVAGNDNIAGYNSAVFGQSSRATGLSSFASGTNVQAKGDYSATFGRNNETTRLGALAIGEDNKALNVHSYAMGNSNTTNAAYSAAIGKKQYYQRIICNGYR